MFIAIMLAILITSLFYRFTNPSKFGFVGTLAIVSDLLDDHLCLCRTLGY